MQIFCRYFDRQLTYLQISATFMQIFCRYVDRQLTYLQISATFMQIFCRYCRPCCSYAAVLQQICDRYLQTFYIYVSLVRAGAEFCMPEPELCFPSSSKMTRKQYEMVNGKTNVKQLITANCQLLLMNSS